ncbi:MAG: DUF3466 family protein [Planctomycetota bacterium]|nr:DUF3466 family protein [Planctomycetota bacterium]
MPTRFFVAVVMLFTGPLASAAVATYSATEITDWTPAQLAALPYFHNYVPLSPSGPTHLRAINLGGQSVGWIDTSYVNREFWWSKDGLVINGNKVTHVGPLGQYSWGGFWEGQWHGPLYGGFIRYCRLYDINDQGIAVGDSTLNFQDHTDSLNESAVQYRGILYNTTTGQMTDITPGWQPASANAINNAGFVTGHLRNHAFRRYPNGDTNFLEPFVNNGPADPSNLQSEGIDINNHGVITGYAYAFGGYGQAPPGLIPPINYNMHAFASIADTPITDLGLPPDSPFDSARPTDINDQNQIVGYTFDSANPNSRSATLWQSGLTGNWFSYDLNSLLTTPNLLLTDAIAVNEPGYIIATGHPLAFPSTSRTYLLTPSILIPEPPIAYISLLFLSAYLSRRLRFHPSSSN